jgi:hypothetical protein
MDGGPVDLRLVLGFVGFGAIGGPCVLPFLWLEDGHAGLGAYSTIRLFRRADSAAAERWRRAALGFTLLAVICWAGIGAEIVALMLRGAA